eukprot:1061235-Pleurochrysis_carterae.AAC.1
MEAEVHEHPARSIKQGARGATHGSTKHTNRVGDVGPRLGRAGHVLALDFWVNRPFALGEQRRFDQLRQVIRGWHVGRAKGIGHTVRKVHAAVSDRDVDIQE